MPYKKTHLILIFTLIFGLFINLSDYAGFLKASLFVDFKRETARNISANSSLQQDLNDLNNQVINCDVVVVGGGSGGVAAAIQSARSGAETCLIEETDWLGGMLTTAGVSAIDGHPETASGIFKEIREKIIHHYYIRGEIEQMRMCKVSTLCFEPHIGNNVIKEMVRNTPNLQLFLNSKVNKVYKQNNKILGVHFTYKDQIDYIAPAKVTIDATEFGDLMYIADIPFDIGFDYNSNEPLAKGAEECIQPLTYVAILKKNNTQTPIPKPKNYDSSNYSCLIDDSNRQKSSSHFDLNHLLNYGKLPNDKLMLNIPSHSCGNDFHATADYLDPYSREEVLEFAKEYTLGFIYFMQEELGLKNFNLYNEFNSKDKMAKGPYVRESRRLIGVARLVEQDVSEDPKTGRQKLVPSSIAIGDYPIDLHYCTTGIGDVFKAIKPYQIPYEALIPKTIDGFIAAEKNISVSHIVNGTTRLQPVVMSIGQAAGAAAAIASAKNLEPRNISISELQDVLIKAKSKIFYFTDISQDHFAYEDVIKLAMNSIIKGNPDLSFKPEDNINRAQLLTILGRIFKLNENQPILEQLNKIGLNISQDFQNSLTENITYNELVKLISNELLPYLNAPNDAQPIPFKDLNRQTDYNFYLNQLLDKKILTKKHSPNKNVSRAEIAVILNRLINKSSN
jgi:hypothetical protein